MIFFILYHVTLLQLQLIANDIAMRYHISCLIINVAIIVKDTG